MAAASELSKLPAAEREERLQAIQRLAVLQAPADELEVPPPVRPMGEYLATEIEKPPELVHPFQVARGAMTALIARAGKGKTTMTLNRALRWSVGRPMFEGLPEVMAPVQPLRILIIENEGAPGFFHEKLQQMFDNQEFTDEEREMAAANMLIWGEGGWPRVKLFRNDRTRGDDFDLVRRGIEIHEPDVLIMEPFRTLWDGEENSATEMTEVTDRIARLASDYKIGVLLTHHERKGGTGEDGEQMSAGRGSTVLEGEAAVMERWRQVKEDQSELSWVKSRFSKPAAPVRMEFVWSRWTYDFVPEEAGKREIKALLLRSAGASLGIREMAEELSESQSRVRRLLSEMMEDPDENLKESPSRPASDGGTTGKRYRYALEGDENEERLNF